MSRRHLRNDVFVIKGFTVQWSAFKLIQSKEISYSGRLLYQYNPRSYHTVVSFYINTMPGDIIQWSAFISIQSQEISYSGRLLYQCNPRRYHTVVGFYINTIPGDIIQWSALVINTIPGNIIKWSAFISIQCQEIWYSGRLLYQYNARIYHTVVSFYINTMPGDMIQWSAFISIQWRRLFYLSFLFFTSFFSNQKITTKQREAVYSVYPCCLKAL